MNFEEFKGCKLALFWGSQLLVYKRDDKASIPFPGQFDLPGGGREDDETPEQCVLRELSEEFSISLTQDRLIYRQRYSLAAPNAFAYFFAGELFEQELEQISLGDEGQYWQLMELEEFLNHANAISHLQKRVSDYLEYRQNIFQALH